MRELVQVAVEQYGFVGIKVHRYDARLTREICEAARAFAMPVLYDPIGEVSIVELIATEYPDVAFIIPHMGSFSDDWRAQHSLIDYLVRHPNIYTDTSGVRRFDLLEQAVQRAGARKILFGSDGPWLHPGVELEKVRLLGPVAGGRATGSRRQFSAADLAAAAATAGVAGSAVARPTPLQAEYRDPWHDQSLRRLISSPPLCWRRAARRICRARSVTPSLRAAPRKLPFSSCMAMRVAVSAAAWLISFKPTPNERAWAIARSNSGTRQFSFAGASDRMLVVGQIADRDRPGADMPAADARDQLTQVAHVAGIGAVEQIFPHRRDRNPPLRDAGLERRAGNGAPAAECPRVFRAAAAPEKSSRRSGSTGRGGNGRSRCSAAGCGWSRKRDGTGCAATHCCRPACRYLPARRAATAPARRAAIRRPRREIACRHARPRTRRRERRPRR